MPRHAMFTRYDYAICLLLIHTLAAKSGYMLTALMRLFFAIIYASARRHTIHVARCPLMPLMLMFSRATGVC